MKKVIILFFILAFSMTISFSQGSGENKKYFVQWKKALEEYPFPSGSQPIIKLISFPRETDENVFLWKALNMGVDIRNNIYVSDNKAGSVYKFDKNGKYILTFGKEGQGPGEFIRPRDVMITGEYVAIHDVGNGRIQYIDFEGKYLGGFKIFKNYWDMTATDEGLIYAAPTRLSNDAPLIDVLDRNGKIVTSFGDSLKYDGNWNQLNRVRLSANRNNEIYVAFWFFPIVRKYSSQGKLLREYNIEHKRMIEIGESNIIKAKKQLNATRSERDGGFSASIIAIKGFIDRCFIMRSSAPVEIIEIDSKGRIASDYWFAEYNYFPADFIVEEEGDEKKFFVLQRSPKNEINIYIPNKGGIK